MIRERPAEAADRAVPGHWEGDLLLGTKNNGIGTLVERSTRYAMLFTLPNGFTAERVSEALAKTVMTLPASLRRSLTWDQGPEMAGHVRFTIDTGVAVYFCDPRSPWQRGSNENTNGLLRQYFPRGQSLAGVTQDELDRVAQELNGRPRQTLDWRSPTQKLAEFMEQSSAASGATTA
jgi:IS30 family transposase